MENKVSDANVKPHFISTLKTTRSELERAIQQSELVQHCFYCNFTLECGQPKCLWREDTD